MFDHQDDFEISVIEIMRTEDGGYMFGGEALLSSGGVKQFATMITGLDVLTKPEFWQTLDKGLRTAIDGGGKICQLPREK